MNHPQQSEEVSVVPLSTLVCDDSDSPAEYSYQILCCPIEYARSASEVKPLPPSTTPLAVEEGESPTRSNSSIDIFREPSREASTNDGEQPIQIQPSSSATTGGKGLKSSGLVDGFKEGFSLGFSEGKTGVAIKPSRTLSMRKRSCEASTNKGAEQIIIDVQPSSSAKIGEEELEPGQVDISVAIKPSRTHSSVKSQRGIKQSQSQSMSSSQSKSFEYVQGGDIESGQVYTGVAIRPSRTHSSANSQCGNEQKQSMYETQSTSFEHVQGHDVATGVAIKSSPSHSSHTHSSHSSVKSQSGIEQPQSIYKAQSKSFAKIQDHDSATILFGRCEEQARQSMGHWKKGATIASMCVCVGLCAVLFMVVTMMES